MKADQKERLERFFTDFENVYNDIQGYLKTKETISTDVMNSFLTGFKLCVDNLKMIFNKPIKKGLYFL